MTDGRSMRILQVVGGMNRGGAETWLMHVLRHIDRDRYQFDFVVHSDQSFEFSDEIKSLGGRLLPCNGYTRPWKYARNLRQILRRSGPYDVVHSHVQHFSGLVMWVARSEGVSGRITHSHLDTSQITADARGFRRLYLNLMERWIDKHSTLGIAVSKQAGSALFGPDWERRADRRLAYCGIDLRPFDRPIDRTAIRRELGLAEDAFVVGHVGRFQEQKNHRFLIQIASRLADRCNRFRLLLVGDGPLRPVIQRQVFDAGLANHVLFMGSRNDIPRLMIGAMDILVMPSLREGLPLVMLEAQAAGLRSILTDTVTSELTILPNMVHHMSLSKSSLDWARRVESVAYVSSRPTRAECLRAVSGSKFNIEKSIWSLLEAYHVS